MPSSSGLAFVGISAFLHSMRYLCVAVICSGNQIMGQSGFDSVYKNIGSELTILSFISLLVGLGILFKGWYLTMIATWKEVPLDGTDRKDVPIL